MKFLCALLILSSVPVLAQEQAPPVFQAAVRNSNYTLGPGDQIRVNAIGYDEFSGMQIILPDGTISLPILGSIRAQDRAPDQLAKELEGLLKPYLKNPVITVSLVGLRTVRINVAGEVQRPGPIQLRSVTDAPLSNTNGTLPPRTPTVSAALQEAGGITSQADIRSIQLQRYSANGTPNRITLNLWDSLWSLDAPRDLALQDGDTLLVPKLAAGETLDRLLVARSSLSPDKIRVRVIGEVKKPGEVEIFPNSTLSSAVAVAGGPTDKANLSQAVFARLNDQGRIDQKVVDLSTLIDGEQIAQGDVIIVPKSGTSTALDFMASLFAPLGGLGSLLNALIP